MTDAIGWRALIVSLAVVALAVQGAAAANGLWTAPARSMTDRLTAYGQVEPQAIVRVRAGETGILSDFTLRPGDRVTSGSLIGRLSGAPVEALVAARNASLTAARAGLAAARQALAIAKQNAVAKLATRDAVFKAKAAVAEEAGRVASAEAALRAVNAMSRLTAPASGRVLALGATAGERVAAGETILTLQPAGSLWSAAEFYGVAAGRIRPGMVGRFTPNDGGAAVALVVRDIAASMRRDGGRIVTLAATSAAPGWYNGEAGRITIIAGTVAGVTVPTRALVLDAGKWWVLLRTKTGERRQLVTPGPSRGEMTLVTKGLAPGAEVMVDNAYLDFHRLSAQRYQPPD